MRHSTFAMATLIAMILLMIATLLWVVGCTKPYNPDENCNYACLLSDKYTADSVFVVRDTLWEDPCINDYWFNKEKQAAIDVDGMFLHCNPFYRNGKLVTREIWTHVFNRNQVIPVKKFK